MYVEDILFILYKPREQKRKYANICSVESQLHAYITQVYLIFIFMLINMEIQKNYLHFIHTVSMLCPSTESTKMTN